MTTSGRPWTVIVAALLLIAVGLARSATSIQQLMCGETCVGALVPSVFTLAIFSPFALVALGIGVLALRGPIHRTVTIVAAPVAVLGMAGLGGSTINAGIVLGLAGLITVPFLLFPPVGERASRRARRVWLFAIGVCLLVLLPLNWATSLGGDPLFKPAPLVAAVAVFAAGFAAPAIDRLEARFRQRRA